MKKSTKKLIIGAGAVSLVGLTVAVSRRITDLLFRGAIEREQPAVLNKAASRISANALDADTIRAASEAAKELETKEHTTVEIDSYDGTRLIGHLFPAEDPKRVLIAMHGWRSTWSMDFHAIADFWHDEHCTVLYVEQRGQGNSKGECIGFGLLERYDCLEWVKWVGENCDPALPVYLAGLSMGATTVLMAAGAELPDYVHGVIADCGFVSADAIWRHVAEDNLHLSYDLRRRQVEKLCRETIGCRPDEYTTLDAMATATVPILFIHGTDDTFVPVSMTYQNYEACQSPKRLLIVDGANHAMSYLVDREGYEDAVRSFWKEFD